VDNDPQAGVWVILNEANRYSATTDVGAAVSLTLRANPEEDYFIYNANPSAFLQGLAVGERHTNRFYYAVEDSHGAIGIGPIDVVVDGVNNIPGPAARPRFHRRAGSAGHAVQQPHAGADHRPGPHVHPARPSRAAATALISRCWT
jgi:hypothetical protein